MLIELEISGDNEGTDSPWWIIIDPNQNMRSCVDIVAGQITGPYFSRKAAQHHLDNRRHAFGKRACVYCMSGYWSKQYKEAFRKSEVF